ncbi:MAG TPA: NADH-quinone oxidoreductase subunit M [Chloroflexi bacterium]|nr:NADH-quinone oxidoreductase subunit M [Chloroflexota bacterium]
MNFPILSVITLTPVIVSCLLFLFPSDRKEEIRITALIAATFTFGLTIYAYFSYDMDVAGYQFVEKYNWVESLGISYYVGVDGISLPMVLLTGMVIFTGVLISWGIDDRPREFFAFLFLLASGVFGVFVALDLFHLFFFYEIAVFPMYLLIAIWGWKVTREYAAMKLTLYLFIGSVLALVGMLAMYFVSGLGTFDMIALQDHEFSRQFQIFWFPFVFFGFAVLAGIFPFHNWSPVGHVAAPTAVSMFHAGVLMKLGAFAALKVGIMLLPDGARYWLPLIVFLALINVVYGAFVAMKQQDLKYVIGYSSVSHMGLVTLGVATLNPQGITGAGLQMFSHGVMTALFFACVGVVYDRAHTRDIPSLGGFSSKLPWVTVSFIIGGFVSMGMPGFSGFVAELPIMLGLWSAGSISSEYFIAPYFTWIVMISVIAIAITASYILRVVQRVFFGEMPSEFEGHITSSTGKDKIAIALLAAVLVLLGVFPGWMAPLIHSGARSVMSVIGGV